MGSNRAEIPLLPGTAGESTNRIAVDVRRFPWIRRLAADYAYDFPSVAPFFSGNPTERSAWGHAIRCAQAYSRHREEISTILSNQQQQRAAPTRAREAASRLADPRTVAIVTGQQAGLFGGPLFTLLKALTTLKLAETVSRDYAVPAVAVFWIDAEDHDWNEVQSCAVFDEALTTRTISLPSRTAGDHPASVAAIKLDRTITAAIDELEQVLPATEFRSQLIADLRDDYRPGVGMAFAFGKWLERILGPRGLVVFDSSDRAAKPLVSSIFVRELKSPGETARLASMTGAELVAHGYHSQVQPHDDSVALFHLDGGRRAIRQQGDRFVVGDQVYQPSELVQEATTNPATFSPNVLLRPIVQDTLFPTACYVAGPNELAYLGQLRRIYERFDRPMPLMYPRASATVVDSAALRFLQKYKPPFESLHRQDESGLNVLLQAQIPPAVEEAFTDAEKTIESQMARLIETIPAIDPTLEGTAKSTLGHMQNDLTTLHGKMIQAVKRRDETLRRQYNRARALSFPGGHAQERAIGFVSFLNQYGPALVDRLDHELPLDLGHHWVVAV